MKKFIMAAIAALTLVIGMTAFAAGDYPYEVSSLTAKSTTGEEYEAIPSDSGFIAEIEVEKKKERNNSDYFIVAAYNDDTLVSLNYAYANIPVGQKIAYGINIPKADTPINQVKAFVWDKLAGAQPLSEVKAIDSAVSEMPTPTPKPTLNPDNLPENVYAVRGVVTDTHKSTGGAMRKGEVSFVIQSSKNWLGEEISKALDNCQIIRANTGDTDIDDHIMEYCTAYIEVSDDDYTFLQITLAENLTAEFKCADFDFDSYADRDYIGTGKLYFFNNGKTTNYKISDDVRLYVNGVPYADVNEGIDRYVKDNTAGSMVLLDTPSESSIAADGKYDIIKVDYYATIVVDNIDIFGDDAVMNILSSDIDISHWNMDLTDDYVSYEIIKNGEKISVSDIKPHDVLSIKYDVIGGVEDSIFYEIIVSDACVTGIVQAYDSEDKIYYIDDTEYKCIDTMTGDLAAGEKYILYLDAFGRIAYCDEEVAEKKIAILDTAYTIADGTAKAGVILPDGTRADYTLADRMGNVDRALDIVWVNKNDFSYVKNPVEDRVVEYSLSNSELVIKNVLTKKGGDDLEYRAAQERIGKYVINSEATSFIYAESDRSADITAMDMNTLIDGNYYEAYFYNRSLSSNIYRFAIVKTCVGQLTADSSMAVVKKYVTMKDEKRDEIVDALVLMIDGEEKTVMADASVEVSGYVEGDAILYGTDAEGYITRIVNLVEGFDLSAGYADLFDAAMAADADLINAEDVERLPETKKGAASLVFGPIVEKTASSITIGAVEATDDGLISDKTEGVITYASDVNFYTYNYNQPVKSRVSAENSVSAISIPTAAYVDWNEKTAFYWNGISELANPRFALVKMVDNEATDVYVIVPKNGLKIDKSSL